jgi:TetR/AcrR family transcriptional repressor of lmrAB and yxaGH operons
MFVRATGELLRRQGYNATGVSEIVACSGAPRGSLYFHFPGGKEELAVAAMTSAGEQLRGAIVWLLSSTEELSTGIGQLIEALAAGLERSGYEEGCPIATVTLEAAVGSEAIRAAADQVFGSWLAAISQRLQTTGVAPDRAERRATLVLAAIEGALILARARRSLEPLLAVRAELAELGNP